MDATVFNEHLLHAGLSQIQIDNLAPYYAIQEVSKGTRILREGDICEHTIFVDKGLLRSFSIDESGKEHIIQFAPESWYVTDRGSVYFQQPAEFFIEAIEDSKIVLLHRDYFVKASEMSSEFVAFNEVALHNHIFHMQRRINLLLAASAEKRYLEFVHRYPNLLLRVPQWMIASYLGITPESLSRVRKELASRNFKGSSKQAP